MPELAMFLPAVSLPATSLHASARPAIAGVTDPVMEFLVGYWPLAVMVVAAVFALGVWWRFRAGLDDHFVGIPPTTIPAADEIAGHPVAQLRRQPPATARSTPPDGLRPAVAGRLAHKSTSPNAEAATLVDLAVRGHLRLQEVKTNRKGKPKDWYLIPSPGKQEDQPPGEQEQRDHQPEELEQQDQRPEQQERGGDPGTEQAPQVQSEPRDLIGYEADLLTAIFGEKDHAVRLKGARPRLQRAFRELRQGVMQQADDRGLFTRPLHISARMSAGLNRRDRSLIAQMLVLVITVLAAVFTENRQPESTVGLLWLAAVLLALWLIVRAATNSTSYRRSATGRARYEQLRGFTEHLSADQTDLDGGARIVPDPTDGHDAGDAFSRYLPYAVALGVTDQWARTFAQAQAQAQAPAQAQAHAPTPAQGTAQDRDRAPLDTDWYTTAGSGRNPGPDQLAAAVAALARTTAAIAAGRGSGFSESDSDGGGSD